MPIPTHNDPFNREWVEISGEKPELVEKFQPYLISILAFNQGGVPYDHKGVPQCVAGSGFIIGTNSGDTFAITAKHVFTKGVLSIQRPHARHAASTPTEFIPIDATKVSIDKKDLCFYWAGSEKPAKLSAWHCDHNDVFDIATAIIRPQEGFEKDFKPSSILLDANEPSVGDVVLMVSFGDHIMVDYVPSTGTSKKGASFTSKKGDSFFLLGRWLSIRMGTVTRICPKGYRQYKWPCFTTSIPATPGMSGGMVIVCGRAKLGVCGIVCADNSPEEARKGDHNVTGESIIASAWGALSMHIPKDPPRIINPKAPTLTLYEMMQRNVLPSAIGIENISYRDRGNGEGTISIIRHGSEPSFDPD